MFRFPYASPCSDRPGFLRFLHDEVPVAGVTGLSALQVAGHESHDAFQVLRPDGQVAHKLRPDCVFCDIRRFVQTKWPQS